MTAVNRTRREGTCTRSVLLLGTKTAVGIYPLHVSLCTSTQLHIFQISFPSENGNYIPGSIYQFQNKYIYIIYIYIFLHDELIRNYSKARFTADPALISGELPDN